jgi:NADPH:quinone reductase-like Zn-dependent oxidoreductase
MLIPHRRLGEEPLMSQTMRAVVLDAPGPPEALVLRELPVPTPVPGRVLIRVRAFGLNRSELHTRLGLAGPDVTFPLVLGIEATGTVAECPGGEFAVGQQVAAMMGGMGRSYDGGYAEYTVVPVPQVVPFSSALDRATLGAVPEMLQTSYGSLTVGLDAQPGQSILIRGGTSSIGMATAVLATRQGMTVLSTTRSAARTEALREAGVDHVLIDDGEVVRQAREIIPDGVDAALELVGRRRCRTPCARCGCTGSRASPGCCRTSGPCGTSTRSTTRRPGVRPGRGEAGRDDVTRVPADDDRPRGLRSAVCYEVINAGLSSSRRSRTR